jgi:hypothetical protein
MKLKENNDQQATTLHHRFSNINPIKLPEKGVE